MVDARRSGKKERCDSGTLLIVLLVTGIFWADLDVIRYYDKKFDSLQGRRLRYDGVSTWKQCRKTFQTRMRKRPLNLTADRLAVGPVVSWEVTSFLNSRNQRTGDLRPLIARRNLSKGQRIMLTDFTLASDRPLKGSLPPHVVTDQQLHLLDGAALTQDVAEGHALSWDCKGSGRCFALGFPNSKGPARLFLLHCVFSKCNAKRPH